MGVEGRGLRGVGLWLRLGEGGAFVWVHPCGQGPIKCDTAQHPPTAHTPSHIHLYPSNKHTHTIFHVPRLATYGDVALKTLAKGPGSELAIMAKLASHPHVVRVFGYVPEPHAIVMELCRGSLKDEVEQYDPVDDGPGFGFG